MKKIFCSVVIAALALLSLFAADNPNEGFKIVATNTVPELVGTNLSAKTFVFWGRKQGHTNNTGIVWIQRTSTNGFGGMPIYPGQKLSITVDTVRARQVDFYCGVETSGDGVVWQLFQ